MKIMSKAELKVSLKDKTRGENWNVSILRYLASKPNGDTKVGIYKATRPDRLDIPESKMEHNVSSQFTYIERRDELAQLSSENGVYKIAAIRDDVAKLIGIKG